MELSERTNPPVNLQSENVGVAFGNWRFAPMDVVVERPLWVRKNLGSPSGRDVRVGVIDSGWDRRISCPYVLQGAGFVDPNDDLAFLQSEDDHDRIGHGTACAELIMRISPEVKLYPLRVFGDCLETSVATLRVAILWAIEQKLRLVNLSLGTLRAGALYPLYTACESARKKGVIIVAATHNLNSWSYPAIFDNVISVGLGSFDSPFDYSYRRDEAVECMAKGSNHRICWPNGTSEVLSGTSFAAPNITGIVALLLERHPHATLRDIRELLARFAASH